MNKDRKITIVSIIMWAVCIILLFGYYTFFDVDKERANNSEQEDSEVIEQEMNKNNQYEDRAKEIMSGMTLPQKIGQLFFARCPENNAKSTIREYNLGAYILFARDFEGQTKESMADKIKGYQENSKIPMLIGVDEEGGTVTRISRFDNFRAEKFWSPMQLYNEGGLDAIEKDTKEKCELLKSIGVNVNFAPVCDIATEEDAFMYERTIGQNSDVTASYIKQMVYQMDSLQVGSVLKHFPGYGNNVDTHVGEATDNRSLDDLRETDFVPFREGIKAGAGCILIAHNIIKSVDSENPASLSEKMHEILREELGYNNVIITDYLDMEGIDEELSEAEIAVKAITAGNDMVITSKYKEQITAIKNAVNNGEISEDRINESVVRVLCWKMSLGLM